MSYLRYLWFLETVMSKAYCVEFLFVLFFFVSCTLLLPVSLDYPFLIAPSVFSNVYLPQGQVKFTLLKDTIALSDVWGSGSMYL